MLLSINERRLLLKIARDSILNSLKNEPFKKPENISENLRNKRGAFVSLHTRNAWLRGCIGTFTSNKPLYITVSEMAEAAAFKDPRFSAIKLNELDNIVIEISVLSPLKNIIGINEIEVGRDGLYIIKGLNRGVLLPQVAASQGWNKIQFLEHTCLKAGLPVDAYKSGADIFTFTAEIFVEE